MKYYDSSSFEEAGVTGVRIEFHLDKLSFKYLLSISYVAQTVKYRIWSSVKKLGEITFKLWQFQFEKF